MVPVASWRYHSFLLVWLLVLAAGSSPAQTEPTRTGPTALSLDQAQQRALAFSPLLQAADLDHDAVLARREQAGRRPNPRLNLDSENFAGTGVYQGWDASEVVLSLSQNIDLGGRRGSRQNLLGRQATLLEFERQRTLLDLQLEVELAFGQVWYAQGGVDLAADRLNLAEELAAEIAVRLEAGGCSPIDLTRARVGLAAAEVGLNQAQETLQAASRTLAALWGEVSPDFQRVQVPTHFWTQPATQVSAESVAGNPDLTRWAVARSVQDAHLALARAEKSLDLELSLGLKLDNATGDRALTLGAGIPLNVSDRNQDELRALSYELESTGKVQQDAGNRVLAQLAAAAANQSIARREMASLAERIIPLAQQAYEETHTAHQRGLYGLTEVLETRRNLFELRQAEMDAKLRFLQATAHLARLTGRTLNTADATAWEEK